MFNKETCQILELNGRTMCFVCPVKQIYEIGDEFLSFREASILEDLFHNLNKLVDINSLIWVLLKGFRNRQQLDTVYVVNQIEFV